jgi:hypothetical protein
MLGALNRVYLNIGLFSEEWLLHFNALFGGEKTTPIEIPVARQNSTYWNVTESWTPAMAEYLIAAGTPHHLEDAPAGAAYLSADAALVDRGKVVFAEHCARCHSSKQPDFVPGVDPAACSGKDYLMCFNQFWAWTKTSAYKAQMTKIVQDPNFLVGNFLSSELRIPVTLTQTNACSPLASNAIGKSIWDNFSSQTYKDLPSVGTITYYHPVTGKELPFKMPGGGRGYTRPASLISVWATAPYLLNNSVGPQPAEFTTDPSVAARIKTFDASIRKMLWPETRDQDPVIKDKVKGPSYIDRTTYDSYIKIPNLFLDPGLKKSLMKIGTATALDSALSRRDFQSLC